jgi:hypothetical protein
VIEDEDKQGVLAIPFENAHSLEYIQSQIETKGEAVVAMHRAQVQILKELDKRLWSLRRKFRLPRVYYESTPQQTETCAMKLLQYYDDLSDLLWNIHLIIGDSTRVRDNGFIQIAWNWFKDSKQQ